MLQINSLKKIYGKQTVLDNVSFEINQGEIVGFIGDNGAGKTTTIKCIFGEVLFDEGSIKINDENIFENYHLQDLCFFPDSNNIPLDLTVDDYVEYTMMLRGKTKEEIKKTKEKVYQLLKLEEHKKKKLKQLSAGLKKRSIMASCLSLNPKVIILDEPTANLDIETKGEFISILKKMNANGVTIMITSHLIDELQDLISKLIIIKEGKIVYNNLFDGRKEKIIDIYNKSVEREKIDLEIVDELFKK
jgi:ABC-2 type transport system ATP-binding protein